MVGRWIQSLLCASLLTGGVAAEQIVVIPDTVLWQGQRSALPIWVRLQLPEQPTELQISLLYSAQRLRILGLRTGGAESICPELSFRDTIFNGDTGRVDLLCPMAGGVYAGILAWLEVEILAGRDTSAWIEPLLVRSGEHELPLVGTRAWIRIEGGMPVEPVGVDELRIAVPSPFASELWVYYAVAQPGWVEFRLFSVTGQELVLEPSRVYVLQRGSHVLRFRFSPWQVSSGGYLLRMVTERGVVRFLWLLCER